MSHQRHGEPGPIPNRWLYCPRNGSGMVAEHFLPFKTPLSHRYAAQMPDTCQFEPSMVFSFIKMFKKKIGLWIDLTNTSRFYDRRDVETRGVQYQKLQCRGHGEAPTEEQTRTFIELVDRFLLAAPNDIIAIHCTHGFNRTGFLIVSYMVERTDCSVEAALSEFARIRPPGIYKEDYIRELFRRYEAEEDAIPAPEMPDWCNDIPPGQSGPIAAIAAAPHKLSKRAHPVNSVETGNGDEGDYADDTLENDDEDAVIEPTGAQNEDGSPPVKRRKVFMDLNATFMAGVPGVDLVTDEALAGQLQELVHSMCAFKKNGFPGSQPVSMNQQNIALLKSMPYRVSWKADGTRYMMLIRDRNQVYFFDRSYSFFQVSNMTFPRSSDPNGHLRDTIVDGEMVIDVDNGLTTPRYLVYDVLHIQGEDMKEKPFYPDRLVCIQKDIIEPRYRAMHENRINRAREPFSMRGKQFWDITTAGALLGPKFISQLTHEPDGLIFQPSKKPYICGQANDVLKWKPLELNSVDFKLRITEESGLGIVRRKIAELYVGGDEHPFARMNYKKALREFDGKIIECKFENNSWVFMRERTDKTFPNSRNTATAVCQSIQCPVTTEMLLDFIKKYRYVKDDEIMPPPRAPAVHAQHQHNRLSHAEHPQQENTY